VRCNRLPVTATGNLSVGRKQALRCRRESLRPRPKRKANLDGGAEAPSHVGRRAPAAGALGFSLVNHANCSESHIIPIRYGIIGLVVGRVMSGSIGCQACGERAVPATMR
jgi:hypothetical protein